jgi:hypothetical protein
MRGSRSRWTPPIREPWETTSRSVFFPLPLEVCDGCGAHQEHGLDGDEAHDEDFLDVLTWAIRRSTITINAPAIEV